MLRELFFKQLDIPFRALLTLDSFRAQREHLNQLDTAFRGLRPALLLTLIVGFVCYLRAILVIVSSGVDNGLFCLFSFICFFCLFVSFVLVSVVVVFVVVVVVFRGSDSVVFCCCEYVIHP